MAPARAPALSPAKRKGRAALTPRAPIDESPVANRAAITIIGDDMHRAHGPAGLHLPSVPRLIRAGNWFAVMSSAPPQKVYEAAAALCASTRGNVFMAETWAEQEIQWVQLIHKLAPGRPLCLATVEGAPC